MSETSTKPYLLRALYEWCTDNGFTPYIVVTVDASTRVPMGFVKNGEIVLNISFDATSHLKIDNDFIHFKARFGGSAREIEVPVTNVSAIYARENGQGMAFEVLAVNGTSTKKTPAVVKAKEVARKRAEGPPTLSAVPAKRPTVSATDIAASDNAKDATPNDEPDPPNKGGRPKLTRIK